MVRVPVPGILGQVFPKAWWRLPSENRVHLTFDDGPHPDTTPFILDQLRAHDSTATFFCLGDSVEKHPDLYARIREEGHGTGIHGWDHLDGWRTPSDTYLKNVERAAVLIESSLFRPPYGRLTMAQWRSVRNRYQVVMWTLLPGDFRTDITSDQLLRRMTRKVVAGDIIVLHENDRSAAHLPHLLPGYLKWLADKGFCTEKLPYAD